MNFENARRNVKRYARILKSLVFFFDIQRITKCSAFAIHTASLSRGDG